MTFSVNGEIRRVSSLEISNVEGKGVTDFNESVAHHCLINMQGCLHLKITGFYITVQFYISI